MKFITEDVEKAISDFDETLKIIISRLKNQQKGIEASKLKIDEAVEVIKNLQAGENN